MARNVDQENCKMYGTKYCSMLNMPSCGECVFLNRQEDLPDVMADLDVLEELMPEGGISSLFNTNECLLCKGEHKNPRACYAMVDMAHPEPKRSKRNAVGIKVKTQVGSLVPVQVACCDACRKRLRFLECLPLTLPIGIGVVSLVVLSMDAVSVPLKQLGMIAPFLVFAGLIALGFLIGNIMGSRLTKAYGEKMTVNILELPKLKEMTLGGWFVLGSEKKGKVFPVFLKKRLNSGIGSALPEDAAFQEGE